MFSTGHERPLKRYSTAGQDKISIYHVRRFNIFVTSRHGLDGLSNPEECLPTILTISLENSRSPRVLPFPGLGQLDMPKMSGSSVGIGFSLDSVEPLGAPLSP